MGQNIVTDKTSNSAQPSDSSQAANKTKSATGITIFSPLEEVLGRAIVGMVKPIIRRGTRLIDLYVTHRDPAMAQRLSDAIGREYIRSSIEQRASFSEDALRYLLEEEQEFLLHLLICFKQE